MKLLRLIPFLLLALNAMAQSTPTIVTNVATLLLLTPVTTKPVYQVLGKVTANDGLGRDVIWSGASTQATNTWEGGGPIARPWNSVSGRYITLTNTVFPTPSIGNYLPLAGGTMSGATVYDSGTITASQPNTIRQTWNNGAVAFNGLLIDITSTANASSTFLDCYDDTNRRFWVSNGGTVNASQFVAGGDATLLRDSANTFGQRNGAVAQTYNLYGTYTDASNYRRLRTTMTTGGAATIAAEGLGTGVSGNTLALSQNGANVLSFDTSGNATIAGTVAIGGAAFKVLSNTGTYDAPSIATLSSTATTLTVTGATVGSPCTAGLTTLTTQGLVISANVSALNTVTVVIFNPTVGAVDLTSGTLKANCFLQ
jgi:hypothetical protein